MTLPIIYQAVNFVMVFRRYKREQVAEMEEERKRIDTEREQNLKMMEELQALKKQLEDKVNAETKENGAEKNETNT